MTGKDRGKTGTVLTSYPKLGKILIEGINVVKKHQKAKSQTSAGQIIERAMPIDVSNVALKDPKGGKATRVGYKIDGKKKFRVATSSGTKL